MATSLAQQLQRLAAPQSALVIHKKSRPSVLFDKREAALLDRDTVFAIGTCFLHHTAGRVQVDRMYLIDLESNAVCHHPWCRPGTGDIHWCEANKVDLQSQLKPNHA